MEMMLRDRNDRGFTVMELMTTLAFVGILSAIALPLFRLYRTRSFDCMAEHDLRNVITAEEAVYSSSENYVSCEDGDCSSDLLGLILSPRVHILVTTRDNDQNYSVLSRHPRGEHTYTYDSALGSIDVQ